MTQEQDVHKRLVHVPAFGRQPIVFITCAVHGRKAVLDNPSAHQALRGLWEQSGPRNGWFVGDYVVMPDHVHLFARQAMGGDALSAWMGMWKSLSARKLLKLEGLTAPVWQSDYFDRYLRSGENYAAKWRYVENNPVRFGLVDRPEHWPYRGRIVDLMG